MSVILEPTRMTLQERSAAASKTLKSMVGFDDLKVLSAALAEVAVAEAFINQSFVDKIRKTCLELAALTRKASVSSKHKGVVQLIPIGNPNIGDASWTGELNPYRLYQLFGADQFRLALEQYTLSTLKDGVELVIAKHPGTKPKTRSKKKDIIDYMIEYVPQDI